MTQLPVVFSFGCPRSGTTFLQRSLSVLTGALTEKIGEGSMLHPWRSPDGLTDLSHLFSSRRVAFVRVVRHPVEVAASFIATRGLAERDPGSFEGLAWNSSRDIVRYVRLESASSTVQCRKIRENDRGHDAIKVRYERLKDREYRSEVARRVCDAVGLGGDERGKLLRALDGFGKTSVRPGRLSHGIDPITEKQRADFAHRLRAVMDREGYG